MAKKAATKKAVSSKASASKKKPVAKKPAPVKASAAKKDPTKKAPLKKAAPAKGAAKKTATKAAPVKKAVAKKTPAKPVATKKAVKKTLPAKKTPAPKASTKKATPVPKKPISQKKPVTKKVVTPKKPTSKATPVKKTEPKPPVVVDKPAPKKEAPAPKAESSKSASKSPAAPPIKTPLKKRFTIKRRPVFAHLTHPGPIINTNHTKEKAKKLSPAFLKAQRQKLLDLRDTLVDQMSGVARDSLGRGDEGSESSAFGMHQADAGSDAYDRDFALNILSQEQNALYEIDEAIVRIDTGEYGICQGSGEVIPQARLEAMPFARCTVEYQEKLDQEQTTGNYRAPVTSLFGLEEKEVSKPSDDEED